MNAPRHHILLLIFAVLGWSATAQGQELRTAAEAEALCAYSKPSTDSSDEAASRESERRKLLHRHFVVTLDHHAAPLIGYDELSGVLAVNAYRPLPIAGGHALVLDGAGPIPFELSAERAQEITAKYVTAQARLKIEFVPAPFADSEQPICSNSGAPAPKADEPGSEPSEAEAPTKEAAEPKEAADPNADGEIEESNANQAVGQHIHGALLRATLVDQLGRPIAAFETALGREVELMKNHNISGFLASAYPQVNVSKISFFDDKPSYPKTSPRVPADLDRALRGQIQKRLYGCYVRGLASNARLQGALVVRFETRPETQATVMVDSLQSPAVIACVTERLAEIGPLTAHLVEGDKILKATLIFRLQDNSL